MILQPAQGEYPATTEIHHRCVSIIGDLRNSNDAVGLSTVGSSEAIHLGGLGIKKRWQQKRMAEGKDTSRPNIIMGHNAQAALEKFARYFDVECRMIPVSLESRYCLDVKKAAEACDENTIGVYVILGSLFTGHLRCPWHVGRAGSDSEGEGLGYSYPRRCSKRRVYCPFCVSWFKVKFWAWSGEVNQCVSSQVWTCLCRRWMDTVEERRVSSKGACIHNRLHGSRSADIIHSQFFASCVLYGMYRTVNVYLINDRCQIISNMLTLSFLDRAIL